MTTIDFANKADIKRLGDAVKTALAAVAEEYGITVSVNGGRYDPTVGTFAPKVEFAATDAAAKEFARWASLYGLTPEDFGRTFRSHGKVFTVAGINTRARTAPIIATTEDGKSYKFSAESVAALLVVAA